MDRLYHPVMLQQLRSLGVHLEELHFVSCVLKPSLVIILTQLAKINLRAAQYGVLDNQ